MVPGWHPRGTGTARLPGRSASQRIGGHNFKGFTFRHFVESWESYLPHLSSRRSTQQHPDQVGTNGSQVGTNDLQVGTNGSQVGTNGPQVGTNREPEDANPNVFNTSDEKSINDYDLSLFVSAVAEEAKKREASKHS